MDFAAAFSSLPAIIGMLPAMLQVSQFIFSLFFIWFFGSMTLRGLRGRKPVMLRISGTLLMGALNFYAAAAFSGFMPFLGEGLFRFLQLDMLAAGIIVAIVLALALTLLTHEKAAMRPEEAAEKLRLKVKGLQEMLRSKAKHLDEKTAMKKAEDALKGYKATSAKLVGNEYEVKLLHEKDEATVVVDAWDGEIISTIRHESAAGLLLKDRRKVAGIAIIAAVAILAAVFFEGFPDPAADMAAIIGMTPEELSDMAGTVADSAATGGGILGFDMPDGCISYAVFMQYYNQLTDRDFLLDHVYNDEATAQAVTAGCGAPQIMIRIDHEGRDLVIAVTQNGRVAYLTDGIMCQCIEVMQ